MPSPTTTTLCWSRFFDLGSKGPCLAHELVFSDEGRRFFCSHGAASAAAGEHMGIEAQSSLVGWSSDPNHHLHHHQQQQQPSSPPRVLSTSRAPVLRRQQQKKTERARRSTTSARTTKTAEHQGVLSASDRVAKLLLEGFYYKNIVVDCTGIAA